MEDEIKEPTRKELSAIDKIYENSENIERIFKLLSVIDNNLKLLSNKITKNQETLNRIEQIIKTPGAIKQDLPDQSAITTIKAGQQQSTPVSESLVIGKIRTFAKILNKDMEPVQNVDITIYDRRNTIIKQVKTDKDGLWEVRLPPGDYGIEYKHRNFQTKNLKVSLKDSMKEYEVI